MVVIKSLRLVTPLCAGGFCHHCTTDLKAHLYEISHFHFIWYLIPNFVWHHISNILNKIVYEFHPGLSSKIVYDISYEIFWRNSKRTFNTTIMVFLLPFRVWRLTSISQVCCKYFSSVLNLCILEDYPLQSLAMAVRDKIIPQKNHSWAIL